MSIPSRKGTIYLCGPITGCSFEEAKHGWRQKVYNQLNPIGINCLSPLRHLTLGQLKEGDKESMNPDGAEVGVLSTPRGLTERDRFDTMRSDIIFCNLLGAERASIGSMIEFGWADARRIPILVCMDEDNIHNHGMVTAIASWIVPTLEEGIEVVQDLLVPSI